MKHFSPIAKIGWTGTAPWGEAHFVLSQAKLGTSLEMICGGKCAPKIIRARISYTKIRILVKLLMDKRICKYVLQLFRLVNGFGTGSDTDKHVVRTGCNKINPGNG